MFHKNSLNFINIKTCKRAKVQIKSLNNYPKNLMHILGANFLKFKYILLFILCANGLL